MIHGFNGMFTLAPMFIGIIFVVIIGVIAVGIVKGLIEWNGNNNSPILTVNAKVVAKRMAVEGRSSHHLHAGHHHHHTSHHSTTYYFSTFEVESGDRTEFKISDREYGMLAEGDVGKLTFQGTRYKGFERMRRSNSCESKQKPKIQP